MADNPSTKDAAQLLYHLKRNLNNPHHMQPGWELSPEMTLLRHWQSERLLRTHADLLASHEFGAVCHFFLSDIYAPRDFTLRDDDVERLHRFMLKHLPAKMLHPLTRAIELNTMTQQLDADLLDALVNQLGVTTTVSAAQYAEGYRLCDNYDARMAQIKMIGDIGADLSRIAHLPFIASTVRLIRRPATQAGWHELQSFLERGLAAFKRVRHTSEFLSIIQDRERQILDRIFTGHPHPFDI